MRDKSFSFVFLIFLISLLPGKSFAQKQLVLLKNEKVKLRLYPGDEIIYRLKGDNQIQKSYINNLFDTALVAHHTVVPFHKIDRIYFKQGNFGNVVGGLMVVGGAGYFLIDQINVVVVQGNEADLDRGVALSSAVLVAVGLPMMLYKKRHQTIGGKIRLRMVEKGSVFYKPDLRQDITGFSD